MTEETVDYQLPSHDDAGWEQKVSPVEKVPPVDWDTQQYVVGVVLEVSEVNVSKTDEAEMRLYVDLHTESGKKRIWANAATKDFIVDLDPGQFVMVRYIGEAISRNGRTYKQFECFIHGK